MTAATHGTYRRYRQGCRETCCRTAAARYEQERQLERLRGLPSRSAPSIGTARRLQALAVMGWTTSELAPRLGTHEDMVHQWRGRVGGRVWLATAERVAAVYDDLSMTRGPSARLHAHALRQGWVPPLAWDDDTIDNPDAEPAPCISLAHPRLDTDEVEFTARQGETYETAGERLGFRPQSIRTHLKRVGRDDLIQRFALNAELKASRTRKQWPA